MSILDDTAAMERFLAEKVLVYANTVISDYPGLSENSEMTMRRVGYSADQVVLMMKSWMLAGRIPSNEYHKTVEWPDGTWQTFKHLHMPQWFKAKFPVRMVSKRLTVTTNHYFVCPHISARGHERHVQFMAIGTDFAAKMRGVI